MTGSVVAQAANGLFVATLLALCWACWGVRAPANDRLGRHDVAHGFRLLALLFCFIAIRLGGPQINLTRRAAELPPIYRGVIDILSAVSLAAAIGVGLVLVTVALELRSPLSRWLSYAGAAAIFAGLLTVPFMIAP